MKRSQITRHIIAGLFIAAISFAWCVWTEGKIPRVVKHTGGGESLQKRWDWASTEGSAVQQSGGFWIGYSVTKWMSENQYYGDNCVYHRSGGITIEQLVGDGLDIHSNKVDEEDELRKVTLRALRNLGDTEAVKEYEENDYEDEYTERELAILAYYDTGRDKTYLEDVKIRRMDQRLKSGGDVLYWLGHSKNDESVQLMWNIFQGERASSLRERLVMAIGVHDAPGLVVPVLNKIVSGDFKGDVKEDAIFWMGQQEGNESLNVLEDILNKERDPELREKTVFALYCHESDGAIGVLSETAKSDRSTKVRKEAIFWLGQMAARKTLDVLSDIVVDSDETELQEHAVFAISQHSDDEAVPTLIHIAKTHHNPKVRKKAIFWLGQTEDDRALDFFVELLRDD